MERLRVLVRSLLGTNSRLYGWGSRLLDLLATLQSDGLATWRTLERLRTGPAGEPVAVRFRRLDHPLWLRPAGEDAFTVLNNVIREEYGQFQDPRQPRWMIDAGAHIGDTSAYFLSRFPGLRVIALEPNPENYALAARNLAPYGERVILLDKALCDGDRPAAISGSGVASALSPEGIAVECTCVETLLAQYAIPRLDILKLDIEGAEDEVLGASAVSWLPRVGLVLLETHGPDIEARVTGLLRHVGFALRRYRSLWYCVAPSPAERESQGPTRADGRAEHAPGTLERAAKFAYRSSQVIALLGLTAGISYLVRSRSRGRLIEVRVPGLPSPICLRGGTSDVGVFESIFIRREYPPPTRAQPRILDLGANSGLASVFLRACEEIRRLTTDAPGRTPLRRGKPKIESRRAATLPDLRPPAPCPDLNLG